MHARLGQGAYPGRGNNPRKRVCCCKECPSASLQQGGPQETSLGEHGAVFAAKNDWRSQCGQGVVLSLSPSFSDHSVWLCILCRIAVNRTTKEAVRVDTTALKSVPSPANYTVLECQMEYYVRYTNVGGRQLYRTFLAGSRQSQSALTCCSACQATSTCVNFTYDEAQGKCKLYQGPSPTRGWGRLPWQYGFTSGLVVRK